MARRRGTSNKKKASDQRKNAREVRFSGGSADSEKLWVVYPLPERLLMNLGRDPYYLIKGSVPTTYEYDPDREYEGSGSPW
jgi:hypothetical protein